TLVAALVQLDTLPVPRFLYVPLNAPHTPWTEPPAELFGGPLPPDASDVEQYNAVLQAMDTELGRLVDALDEQWDRTTVIVMGDNGTPSHAVSGSRDPDRQKHSLFEGGVHVPLIVTGPHVAQPGAVSDALVHVADVMPTVAAIAGVPLSGPRDALELDVGDEVRTLDGQSWLPLLADPKAPGADLIYLESFLPHGEGPHDGINRRMVSDGDYKLVRTKNSEALYRIDPRDLIDPDGSDLLDRSLDGAAETAFTALTDAMDRLEAEVGYEGR
ncbi:MAG: sulfatase-like hydrolase/transferase, partial [Myxococcota bacterium]